MTLGIIPIKGAINLSANLGTNAADGVAAQDLVTVAQLGATATDQSWKNSVRLAATAAGTLASDFEAGDTVDSVVLVAGNRILIPLQADPIENGIYVVQASGAPVRATDFSASTAGTSASAVKVEEGTVNAELEFVVTTIGNPVPGTDANNWALYPKIDFGTANMRVVIGSNNVAADLANINAKMAELTTPEATVRGEIWLFGKFALGTTPFDLADFITFRAFGASFDLNGTNVTGAFFRGDQTDFDGVGGANLTLTSGTSTNGFFSGRDIEGVTVTSWTGVIVADAVTGHVRNCNFGGIVGTFAPTVVGVHHEIASVPTFDLAGLFATVKLLAALSATLSAAQGVADITFTGSGANNVLVCSGDDTFARVSMRSNNFITLSGKRAGVEGTLRTLKALTASGAANYADISCDSIDATALAFTAALDGQFVIRVTGADATAKTFDLGARCRHVYNWGSTAKIIIGTAAGESVGSTIDYNAIGDGTDTSVTLFGHATQGVNQCTLNLRLAAAGSTVTIQDLVVGCVIHVWSDTIPVIGATAATQNQIFWHNITTGETISLGVNMLFRLGIGASQAPAIVKANVNTTAVGNVGAGEDDLMIFSLLANSLSANGKGVRITAWGTTGANANTKTIRLKFGATIIREIGPSAINGLDWRIDGLVIRTGAATQDAMATESLDTIAPDTTISTPSETLSGTVVIKMTGIGVADNDIVQQGMLVEYLN